MVYNSHTYQLSVTCLLQIPNSFRTTSMMHTPFDSHENEASTSAANTTYLEIPDKRTLFRTPPELRLSTISLSDDGYSSVMSSPVLPPEASRPGTPLLNHMSPEPESTSHNTLLPAEPAPAFDPPAYRSVAWRASLVQLPAYSRWGDKYSPVDLESSGAHYNQNLGLAAYGWRVYGVVILVIAVTLITIVVALTRTIGNNNAATS